LVFIAGAFAGWPNYWIMNNFVVFVPIIMANNFVE